MSISLSQSAANRVKHLLDSKQSAAQSAPKGLRLGVKQSGCSGYAYMLDYVDAPSANDVTFDCYGVQVYVDAEHLPFLQGIELDYVEDGFNSTFQFKNPNVTEECGCGESFTTR